MNEKQQLAATIKALVEQLSQKMQEAKASGLTVKLTPPNEYLLRDAGRLQVDIYETTTY